MGIVTEFYVRMCTYCMYILHTCSTTIHVRTLNTIIRHIKYKQILYVTYVCTVYPSMHTVYIYMYVHMYVSSIVYFD